jgi:hypothetical protein
MAEISRTQDPPSGDATCRCGCGRVVRRTFAQGHDQILLAELRHKVSAGEMTSDQALVEAATISPAFGRKVAKSLSIVAGEKARAASREPATAVA